MSAPEVSVIVPTYREAENLPVLIERIDRALRQAGLSGEILIVDDNSPDGTPEVIARLQGTYPVSLLVRTTERGLSSAVIAGMDLAAGAILLVMDADLSHPPEEIGNLVAALRDPQVDFVIGSRYVAGGTTDGQWGFFRWLNSRGATWLARPFCAVSDPMAGFFALRRSRFLQARERLNPVGYKIGLELIVKCDCRRIAEVPIHFSDRLHGESKLSLREQVNYLRHLGRLAADRYPGLIQFVQFLAIGGTGLVVDLALFAALWMICPAPAARALAIAAAMTWNFVLNRQLTFAAARADVWWVQYLRYCGGCTVGGVVNWLVSLALLEWVPLMIRLPLLAALAGVVAGTGFNFVLCRRTVFRTAPPVPRPSVTAPPASRRRAA